MAVDLEDDELDQEDKPKKPPQPPPQAIGTPIQPTTGEPASKFQDVRPIMPQQSTTPAIAPIMPDAAPPAHLGTNAIGSPIGPTAPRPAGERAEALATKGPPEYHGWNRFLDTLGRVTGPGQAIEAIGGYGTLGYNSRLNRADTQAQAEERQIEGGEKERQAKATLEETQARAGAEEARGEAARAGMESVMITLPGGRQITVPKSQLGPDVRAMITEEGAGQRTAATNASREGIAADTNQTREDIAAGKVQPHITTMVNGEAHIMERDPKTGAYTIDRGKAVPSYGATAPQTRTTELLGADNVMHRFQFNPDTKTYDIDLGPAPTGQAAHQIFQAGAIEEMAPHIIDDINANREILGNLSSYYKQWLSGTPVSDPRAAKMMGELMSFAATQPALHAFRSTNAMEAFEKIIGGLAKDPDATVATIQGMLVLPKTFTDMPQRGGAAAGGAGGGAEHHDEGTTRTNRRTGEVQTWTKDKTGKLGWQTTTQPRQ